MSRRQINFRLDELVVDRLDEIARRKKLKSRTSAVEHAATYYYSELLRAQAAAGSWLESLSVLKNPDSILTLANDSKVELDGDEINALWSIRYDWISNLEVLLIGPIQIAIQYEPWVELELASWLHGTERPADTYEYKVSDLSHEMQRFGMPFGFDSETDEERIARLATEWMDENKT